VFYISFSALTLNTVKDRSVDEGLDCSCVWCRLTKMARTMKFTGQERRTSDQQASRMIHIIVMTLQQTDRRTDKQTHGYNETHTQWS